QFEDRLTARDIVAAVAVEKDHPLETVPEHILRKTHQQVQIRTRRRGQCSRKIEVMIRITEPEDRSEHDLLRHRQLGPTDYLSHELGVGEHWQMGSMLFECSDGKHDRCFTRQRSHLRRSEFGEVHGESRPRMQIRWARSKEGDKQSRGLANNPSWVRNSRLPTLAQLTVLGIPDADDPTVIGTHDPSSIATHRECLEVLGYSRKVS
ncbi:MAG: hypothetical protein RJB04_828, partial [Verrucomicrobiota bacterium]